MHYSSMECVIEMRQYLQALEARTQLATVTVITMSQCYNVNVISQHIQMVAKHQL